MIIYFSKNENIPVLDKSLFLREARIVHMSRCISDIKRYQSKIVVFLLYYLNTHSITPT